MILLALYLNIFIGIILLGAIQGVFLATVFLFIKKLNQKSNRYLALLLISFSIVNLANSFWAMGIATYDNLLGYLPLNWTLLIPFSLYYFVQYLINPNYKFSPKEYLFLIPFVIQQLSKIYFLFLFLTNKPQLANYQSALFFIPKVLEIFAVSYTVIVFILLFKKVNIFQKQLKNEFAEIENRSLAWVKNILQKAVILIVLWIIPYTISFFTNKSVGNYMYPLWLGMSVAVYWLGFAMFSKRDLFEYTSPEILHSIIANEINFEKIYTEIRNESESKLEKSNIEKQTYRNEPEIWEEQLKKLTRLMEVEKVYLDMDINLSSLSKKLDLSSGYLSQIINQKKNQTFYDYINYYRVEEVKKQLINPANNHLNLYGIAMDCGFKSKSTFNLVFKKFTGLTPTEYKQKQAS